MRKLSILVMAVVAAMAVGGCGSRQQPVPFDDGDSADIANADPTLYGICGVATTMNTLQMISDLGDTLTFDLTEAYDNGKVFGGLQAGDRMVVVPDTSKTVALTVVNQSTLLGDWVMPNPLDGSDEVGISIKEGGIAESINQSTIIYKTWRLVRGQLELVSTREDGSGEDEVSVYELVKLDADSLIYKDAEDSYEYGHQHGQSGYGTGTSHEDDDDYSF